MVDVFQLDEAPVRKRRGEPVRRGGEVLVADHDEHLCIDRGQGLRVQRRIGWSLHDGREGDGIVAGLAAMVGKDAPEGVVLGRLAFEGIHDATMTRPVGGLEDTVADSREHDPSVAAGIDCQRAQDREGTEGESDHVHERAHGLETTQ